MSSFDDQIFGLQDVYRIGTLMELVRALALSFADDGKRVKVFFLLLLFQHRLFSLSIRIKW